MKFSMILSNIGKFMITVYDNCEVCEIISLCLVLRRLTLVFVSGVPWCFRDPSVSQGGQTCPNDISASQRVDCHPEPNADKDVCLRRGCFWCQSEVQGVPWCFHPKQTGYRQVGEQVATPLGWYINLQRVNTPSLYGDVIENVRLDVEFQTDNRLRLKVRNICFCSFFRVIIQLNQHELALSHPNIQYAGTCHSCNLFAENVTVMNNF